MTLIRTADYDDGPKIGNVRITTVSMLGEDGNNETAATFRKGRSVELSRSRLDLAADSSSRDNWTLVETIEGTDDDRPATIRLTTTRSERSLVTLKEVDFRDDDKAEWLIRNRTSLEAQ